jgi:hypothetical protein
MEGKSTVEDDNILFSDQGINNKGSHLAALGFPSI